MSGPNHITGGLVFSGIFCSFWNINIFASPIDIVLCVLFSVLPDIDHTKSIIGKVFYPIAKYLDKNYGHRTITHSLLVYVLLFALCSFVQNIWFPASNIALIFAFSYLSHLIFDMMTKQGVPLLYPFKRNPCVIPGNPDYRFKSSDLKTESIIFVIFILLGTTCQPLFANGFWSNYNSQFGTLKHLNQEFRASNDLLQVQYKINRLGKTISGKGYLLSAKENQAIIFEKDFTTITKEDRLESLSFKHSGKKMNIEESFFFDIKPDSLLKLVSNKPIASLKIQSPVKISYFKDNKTQESKSLDLEYTYNPRILFLGDSSLNDIQNRIEILEFDLQKEIQEQDKYSIKLTAVKDSISFLSREIKTMEYYEREKATESLHKLRDKLATSTQPDNNAEKIKLQLSHLYEKLNSQTSSKCSGYISYFLIQ